MLDQGFSKCMVARTERTYGLQTSWLLDTRCGTRAKTCRRRREIKLVRQSLWRSSVRVVLRSRDKDFDREIGLKAGDLH